MLVCAVDPGKEIVRMPYKPSCVFNIDDHPQRVKDDVPNSTHRTDFLRVGLLVHIFLVSSVGKIC